MTTLAGSSPLSVSSAELTFNDDLKRLHDVWYRRRELCDMKWSHNSPSRLAGCLVTAAANGGPIATLRDKRVLQQSRGAISSDLQIFTSGGSLISTSALPDTQLVTMKWTKEEHLVCVAKNGVVRVFSIFGEMLYCYQIDSRLKEENGIVSAIVSPDEGVIVFVSGDLNLFANLSFTHSHCVPLADVPITSPPCCMRAIPKARPSKTVSSDGSSFSLPSFAVLVALEQGPLYLVDQLRSIRLPVSDGPFTMLCTSPSGRNVSCISLSGEMQVFNTDSDFSRPLDKAVLRFSGSPRQVCWVGEDCLACHLVVPMPSGQSENFVFIGGPNNEWLPYQFGPNTLHLVSEVDGVRIIGQTSFFIHRVARSTMDILSIESCCPAAMLMSGCYHYSNGVALVNDAMKAVLPELPQAVASCIDAAEREVDPGRVSMLLKSAAFGRLFLRDYVSEKFSTSEKKKEAKASETGAPNPSVAKSSIVEKDKSDSFSELQRQRQQLCKRYLEAVRDLRVVMALHNLPTEMLLTVAQLRRIGPSLLMHILSQRRLHLMALRVGEWLGLGETPQIVKIHNVIHEDCSREIRDVCTSFWQSQNVPLITSMKMASAQPIDATRPAGVSLALPAPSISTSMESKDECVSSEQGKAKSILTRGPAVIFGSQSFPSPERSPLCFVLEDFVKKKIATSVEKTDQELLTFIRGVFDQYPNIRPQIIQIALWVARHSRPNLATLLLQYEPRSRVQVRVLLRLAEVNLAVKQSVTIGDADLIVECFEAIMHEEESEEAIEKLVDVLERFPLLWDFYEVVCDRAGMLGRIQRLHERVENVARAGYDCVLRSIRESKDLEKKKAFVAHASGFFGSSRELGQKGLKAVQQLSLENVELINIQMQLEQKATSKNWPMLPIVLMNKSLAETVKELYARGQLQEVLILQKLFEISPKRLLKIQVEALLDHKLPDEVVALGQSKSNQLLVGGVEFFIKALHRTGHSGAAAQLLSSVSHHSNLERVWFSRLFPQPSTATPTTTASVSTEGRLKSIAGSLVGSLFSRSSSS